MTKFNRETNSKNKPGKKGTLTNLEINYNVNKNLVKRKKDDLKGMKDINDEKDQIAIENKKRRVEDKTDDDQKVDQKKVNDFGLFDDVDPIDFDLDKVNWTDFEKQLNSSGLNDFDSSNFLNSEKNSKIDSMNRQDETIELSSKIKDLNDYDNDDGFSIIAKSITDNNWLKSSAIDAFILKIQNQMNETERFLFIPCELMITTKNLMQFFYDNLNDKTNFISIILNTVDPMKSTKSKRCSGLHWVAFFLDIRNDSIYILDSLSTTDYSKFFKRISLISHCLNIYLERFFSFNNLKFFQVECQKQQDSYNCGIYASYFIEKIVKRENLYFDFVSNLERDRFRKIITDEKIDQSSSNGLKKPKFISKKFLDSKIINENSRILDTLRYDISNINQKTFFKNIYN